MSKKYDSTRPVENTIDDIVRSYGKIDDNLIFYARGYLKGWVEYYEYYIDEDGIEHHLNESEVDDFVDYKHLYLVLSGIIEKVMKNTNI